MTQAFAVSTDASLTLERTSVMVPVKDRREAVPLEPITVRIPDALRLTGIGRSKLYELIQEGRIKTVKVGRMTLVRVDSLRTLLAVLGSDGATAGTERLLGDAVLPATRQSGVRKGNISTDVDGIAGTLSE